MKTLQREPAGAAARRFPLVQPAVGPGHEEDPLQLAEVNISQLREPLDSPAMAGLLKAFDDVMWLAEKSPGFVWRLKPDGGGILVTAQPGNDREIAVTLSVWEDYDSLRDFVFRSAHGLFMGKRAKWFLPMPGYTTALWWVEHGEQPSLGDALERLNHLRTHGPAEHAFSLREEMPPQRA